MPLRQRLRRLRGLHPFSDLTRFAEDLLERLATAELDADAAVARQRAGAGKDEVAHAGESGNRFEGPGQLDAGDVVGAVEPERAAAEHPLRRVREVVVVRRDDGDGGIAARGLEREGRPGEYGEGAQLLAENLRGDLRHRFEGPAFAALRRGGDGGL